jgi:putative nucleotidyltransferase with HDIG domain
LIISSQDKELINKIRAIKMSGIFFSPASDAIKQKLDAVLALKTQNRSEEHDFDTIKVKILAKAEAITSLPAFAQKLLHLTQSNDSTVKEVTEQIKMDQGISGKVIRLVNSPFYGLRQNVSSIDKAVSLLGFNTLKNIALIVTTNNYYRGSFDKYRMSGQSLWKHAYRVALLSEVFAGDCGEDTDKLFLAGLFHDIGKIPLADFLVKPVSSWEDEVEQVGISHTDVAKFLLTAWKLDEKIINTVALHHSESELIQAKILYYANIIVNQSSFQEDQYKQTLDNCMNILPFKSPQNLFEKVRYVLFTG